MRIHRRTSRMEEFERLVLAVRLVCWSAGKSREWNRRKLPESASTSFKRMECKAQALVYLLGQLNTPVTPLFTNADAGLYSIHSLV